MNSHFDKFLNAIENYLYGKGWYTNGHYIRQNCKTFEEVETYLFEHCFSKTESQEIVARLKLETL